MNTGMGSMLNDKTPFGSANLLPAGLVTVLDGVKTNMSSLDLTSLNYAVCQFISLECISISKLIFLKYKYMHI